MRHTILTISILLIVTLPGVAQENVTFQDVSFPLGAAWSEVGDINVHPISGKAEIMDGSGVLLNMPGKKNKGADIYSNEEYGSFDLSFYYMMFPGSNSGVYLQGNYEIQLLDSWGVEHPTSGDNGGIYERWTEEGVGYEGRAPRQNASRAPGIWQHMMISFTAPEFDEAGEKTANARVSVTLNGVPIHSDVELSGPTRGASDKEKARGPIRIQGDHGPIAVRDMEVIAYDSPKPVIHNLRYKAYKGKFVDEPDYSSVTPAASGETDLITPEVRPVENDFLVRYEGKLEIQTPGTYRFVGAFPGGSGALSINGQEVIPYTGWGDEGTVTLEVGTFPFDLRYAKVYEWVPAGLSVGVEGPGIRLTELADATAIVSNVVDPIYLDAPNILRSFMDIPDEGRVVRAVSVGTESNVHYTYDLDNGSVVHMWRGAFLNTTPMWHDRGDGSSVPRGSVCYFDGTSPPVQPLSPEWQSDTTGLHFGINGYRKTNDEGMSFMYSLGDYQVEDHILPMVSGKGLVRTVSTGVNSPLYIRLGQMDDAIEAEIRLTASGEMELIAPLGNSLTYSILF